MPEVIRHILVQEFFLTTQSKLNSLPGFPGWFTLRIFFICRGLYFDLNSSIPTQFIPVNLRGQADTAHFQGCSLGTQGNGIGCVLTFNLLALLINWRPLYGKRFVSTDYLIKYTHNVISNFIVSIFIFEYFFDFIEIF